MKRSPYGPELHTGTRASSFSSKSQIVPSSAPTALNAFVSTPAMLCVHWRWCRSKRAAITDWVNVRGGVVSRILLSKYPAHCLRWKTVSLARETREKSGNATRELESRRNQGSIQSRTAAVRVARPKAFLLSPNELWIFPLDGALLSSANGASLPAASCKPESRILWSLTDSWSALGRVGLRRRNRYRRAPNSSVSFKKYVRVDSFVQPSNRLWTSYAPMRKEYPGLEIAPGLRTEWHIFRLSREIIHKRSAISDIGRVASLWEKSPRSRISGVRFTAAGPLRSRAI